MRDFTEELIHSIALAEVYGKCIDGVKDRIENNMAPGSYCHVDTSSAAQEGPVAQGFADGNVAVIGHDSQKTILRSNKAGKENDLGNISCIGDVPGVPGGTGHEFEDSGRDGANNIDGDFEEEEVQEDTQAVVAGYGGDDKAFAHEDSQAIDQEEPEVQELHLPCV